MQAQKGMQIYSRTPGHAPPWTYRPGAEPPEIPQPFFQLWQPVLARYRAFLSYFAEEIRRGNPVPPAATDDGLIREKDHGISEWFPAWYRRIDVTSVPKFFGRLEMFNFSAHIPDDWNQDVPTMGWAEFYNTYTPPFPEELKTGPTDGIHHSLIPPSPEQVTAVPNEADFCSQIQPLFDKPFQPAPNSSNPDLDKHFIQAVQSNETTNI